MPEGPDAGFVGREPELAAVDRAVVAARDGVPSVLLVGGDAGIGKSTLIGEATRRSVVAAYLGRCVPMGGEVIPLAPWVDLLRQVRRAAPEAVAGSPELAALTQRLAPAINAPGSGTVGGIFLPVLQLVAQLASDHEVMVGVEDLHWADEVSWDLFEFLARNLVDERVVLVGTYRANEINLNAAQRRRLAELARLPAVHRIHLGGLGRDDVAARVTSILGYPADPSLVEEMLSRGQGNPFFTEELVAAHRSGEAIPAVLLDLVSADVAGLDDETRRVLEGVATIGAAAHHEMLKRTALLDDDAIEAAMRTAMARQLIVVDADTDAYRFRHALIGEVVYAQLLPSERRRLHQRVAEGLREQSANTLTRLDIAGALAFHLDRAGDQTGAFLALLSAADIAETIAPAAALHHLQRAFELWDHVGAAAEGLSRGDRLWQAAELATGTAGNQRAADLARAAFAYGPPPRGEAWGHERLGRYLWAAGHLRESAVELERAAALLTEGNIGPEAAPTFAGLAQADLMLRNYESAERRCHRVFDLVPSASDDPLAWMIARRVLGGVRSAFGEPERGVELCRESVAAAQSAHTRALAVLYLCLALLDAGRYPEAVSVALDGVADGHLAGVDHSFGGYMDSLAAEGLIRLGRWSEAETVLARHLGVDQLPVGAIRLGRVRALLAARRGDNALARASLEQAEAQPLDPFHSAFLDEASSEIHLILGDWDLAAAAAQSGWDNNPPGAVLWSARFAMHLANAVVEQTLHAQAVREPVDCAARAAFLQERIASIRRDTGSVDVAAHLAHAGASVTRLTGPDPDAWADAAQHWELVADPWHTATARMHEAEAAASTGDAARASIALQDAQRLASELTAQPLLDEIAAVSRRTRLSVDAPVPVLLDDRSVDRLGLTPREAEVLALVAAGLKNRQIGEALYVSEKTASVHVSNILRKLGVTSRVDAAAIAQRLGVT